MKKYLILAFVSILFVLFFTTSISAQIYSQSLLLGSDLLMSDWQLDYIQPLEPGELEKGEYRFSPLIARVNILDERKLFPSGDISDDSENSTNVYAVVFDTAFSDDLTVHGKYLYQPWTEYDNDDESRFSLLDLFINYKVKEDNTLYFGYNRSLNKEKNYNEEVLNSEDEAITNFYYLGYEMRGSFGFDD